MSDKLKKLFPWVYFVPPDQVDREESRLFLETIIEIRQRDADRSREEHQARIESIRSSFETLAEEKLSPEIQNWIQDNISELNELGKYEPDRFTLDCHLPSLPTKELALHARMLLLELTTRAGNNDLTALEEISEIAQNEVGLLSIFERTQPENIRSIARRAQYWPFLISNIAELHKIEKRLTPLEIGSEDNLFRCEFRAMAGKDEDYPARIWAKHAVKIVEETRFRIEVSRAEKLFDVDRLADHGFEIGDLPEWLIHRNPTPGKLPPAPFSTATLPIWLPFIRNLIRTDCPDFHEHKDWENQRRNNEARGRGAIQSAILDDIGNVLKRLAPISPKITEISPPS